MRNVLNISLPEQMTRQFETAFRRSHHASKSEFFRYIFHTYMREQTAIKDVKKSQAEYRAGKAIRLTKIEDLWS